MRNTVIVKFFTLLMITIAVLITYKTTIIEYFKGKFIGCNAIDDKKMLLSQSVLKL